MIDNRNYDLSQLPINEDLSQFAPPYFPAEFSGEQKRFLNPFFSNLDRPVYLTRHLPEEVAGALGSRYSRATADMRSLFWREYARPVLYPERQPEWNDWDEDRRTEAFEARDRFTDLADYINSTGGVEGGINTPRARRFFSTWYVQFGDESIAEKANFHGAMDGISNVVQEVVVDKRLSLPIIIKSSRYVPFNQKRPDDQYQFVIPGEIKGTELESEYVEAMEALFSTYTEISEPYVDYIKERYPKGDEESDESFDKSRGAKRFDDTRDLLPFSTQSAIAWSGNARSLVDLTNNLLGHPLGEARWWGQQLSHELHEAAPSLFVRPREASGGKIQQYRRNLQTLRNQLAQQPEKNIVDPVAPSRWVELIDHTPDAEVAVASAFLFAGSSGLSFGEINDYVWNLPDDEIQNILGQIVGERKFGAESADRAEARFRKVPREFEYAHYVFQITGRGGDYRDIHRHRQLTEQRQRFTTGWGFDLEKEVLESPFAGRVQDSLAKADAIFRKIEAVSPDAAQYAVPFGALQHWVMDVTARQIYWMSELRTGPQGRPHYREIFQQMTKLAMNENPGIFQGILTDWGDYSLSRRESELKIENKLKKLQG